MTRGVVDLFKHLFHIFPDNGFKNQSLHHQSPANQFSIIIDHWNIIEFGEIDIHVIYKPTVLQTLYCAAHVTRQTTSLLQQHLRTTRQSSYGEVMYNEQHAASQSVMGGLYSTIAAQAAPQPAVAPAAQLSWQTVTKCLCYRGGA